MFRMKYSKQYCFETICLGFIQLGIVEHLHFKHGHQFAFLAFIDWSADRNIPGRPTEKIKHEKIIDSGFFGHKKGSFKGGG